MAAYDPLKSILSGDDGNVRLTEKVVDQNPTRSTSKTQLTTTTTTTERPALHDFLIDRWKDLTDLLKRPRNCRNKSVMLMDGTCECRDFFEGYECEKKICLNGGKLEKPKYGLVSHQCKCPDPLYIGGSHCETVTCSPNGALLILPNNTWECKCIQPLLYGGKYCEKLEVQSGFILFPLLLIIAFVALFLVCKADMCPRRRPSHHESRGNQRRRSNQNDRRTATSSQTRNPRGERRAPQECLLTENHSRNLINRPFSTDVTPPYVVRLDTIPTFNPLMIGGVQTEEDLKPFEPPPPYEQALSAPKITNPPAYTPSARENSTTTTTPRTPATTTTRVVDEQSSNQS